MLKENIKRKLHIVSDLIEGLTYMNRFHVSLFTYFFGCTISLNCHPVNKCLKNLVALLNQSK